MKKLLRINEDGWFIEDVLVESVPMIDGEVDEEGNMTQVPDPLYISTPSTEGLYLPKWDGEKWVEGKTQAEVDVFVAEKALEDTRVANEITLMDRAKVAITNNKNYLALDPPTTVQALKQVRTLTVQINALIRLVVGDLDNIEEA